MKKHLPQICWILALALLCLVVVFDRMGTSFEEPSQIILRHVAYEIAILGLVLHTIFHKEDNVSYINYGYKILGEGIAFLAICVACINKLWK